MASKKFTLAERAAEARAEGLKTFKTPDKPCRKCGGVERRTNRQAKCVVCDRQGCVKHYQENPDYFRKYYQANVEHLRDYNRQWTHENAEYMREYHRQYYQQHVERYRENNRRWRKENKSTTIMHKHKRRAAQLQRTLCGGGEQLEWYYELASIQNEFLNSPGWFHVDHVVPLRGKNVSGLHTAENLEVIPATENISKGNRFIPIVERFDSEGRVIETYELSQHNQRRQLNG